MPKVDQNLTPTTLKVNFHENRRLSRYLLDHVNNTFFNCYLAAPQPTLGHSQGDSLPNPMLITAFYLFWPEGYREPRYKVGSLSPSDFDQNALIH